MKSSSAVVDRFRVLPLRPARALALLTTAVLTLALAACSSSPSVGQSIARGAGAASGGKSYAFVDVPGITTDPFYISLYDGGLNQAKKEGASLSFEGSAQEGAPPSVQVGVVNSVFASHPSGLIISPSNVTALQAPIAKFHSAGIPVVAVDTSINDTSLLVTHITSNNYQGGELAAQTIAKEHHDQGEVAVENVQPGVSTTDARLAGFQGQMKKYPKMSIVAVEDDLGEATTAEAQAKSLILAHPNLVGIFGTNLDGGEGAGDAVSADNDQSKITVAAYDAEPAEVTLLKQGVLSVLIMQQPKVEGQDAVKYMYDYVTGHKSEIPKSVLVPNVVATTATANKPDIEKYYYTTKVDK